ncbi:MAG: hypothetical protein ACLU80_03680 [Dorea sp.]
MILGVVEMERVLLHQMCSAIFENMAKEMHTTLGNLEMAKVSKEEITFYNLDGEEIQKKMKTA